MKRSIRADLRRPCRSSFRQNGVQTAFWGELDRAPRAHMVKAFAQRRKQIVGDCAQLKIDVDVYNEKHADEPRVQLVLDFTDDVAEQEAAEHNRAPSIVGAHA